jgi:hypothetical protein
LVFNIGICANCINHNRDDLSSTAGSMSYYRADYEGLSFPHLPAIFGRILRHHRVGSDDVFSAVQHIPEAATRLVGVGFIIVAFVDCIRCNRRVRGA